MSNLNAGETVVVVQDVCKEFYRDQLTIPVLSGINLQLSEGDYLALMGPSGSGKTTLLNLIAGLDRPTSGDVVVCGQNLGQSSEGALAKWRSRHVGFIFQMYNLIPVLTACENVELPLTLTSLSRRQRDDHVKAALVHQRDHRVGGAGDLHGDLADGLVLELGHPVALLVGGAALDVAGPGHDIDLAFVLAELLQSPLLGDISEPLEPCELQYSKPGRS